MASEMSERQQRKRVSSKVVGKGRKERKRIDPATLEDNKELEELVRIIILKTGASLKSKSEYSDYEVSLEDETHRKGNYLSGKYCITNNTINVAHNIFP